MADACGACGCPSEAVDLLVHMGDEGLLPDNLMLTAVARAFGGEGLMKEKIPKGAMGSVGMSSGVHGSGVSMGGVGTGVTSKMGAGMGLKTMSAAEVWTTQDWGKLQREGENSLYLRKRAKGGTITCTPANAAATTSATTSTTSNSNNGLSSQGSSVGTTISTLSSGSGSGFGSGVGTGSGLSQGGNSPGITQSAITVVGKVSSDRRIVKTDRIASTVTVPRSISNSRPAKRTEIVDQTRNPNQSEPPLSVTSPITLSPTSVPDSPIRSPRPGPLRLSATLSSFNIFPEYHTVTSPLPDNHPSSSSSSSSSSQLKQSSSPPRQPGQGQRGGEKDSLGNTTRGSNGTSTSTYSNTSSSGTVFLSSANNSSSGSGSGSGFIPSNMWTSKQSDGIVPELQWKELSSPHRRPVFAISRILNRHMLVAEKMLEKSFPGLEIDLENPMGAGCPSVRCRRMDREVLSIGELFRGFTSSPSSSQQSTHSSYSTGTTSGISTGDPNKYTTRCAHCGFEFVPRFTVKCSTPGWMGGASPSDTEENQGGDNTDSGQILWCELLSPWTLRKEMFNVLFQDGVSSLLSEEFHRSSAQHAVVFWNAIISFRLRGLPYAFLLSENQISRAFPARVAVIDKAKE